MKWPNFPASSLEGENRAGRQQPGPKAGTPGGGGAFTCIPFSRGNQFIQVSPFSGEKRVGAGKLFPPEDCGGDSIPGSFVGKTRGARDKHVPLRALSHFIQLTSDPSPARGLKGEAESSGAWPATAPRRLPCGSFATGAALGLPGSGTSRRRSRGLGGRGPRQRRVQLERRRQSERGEAPTGVPLRVRRRTSQVSPSGGRPVGASSWAQGPRSPPL